MKTIKLLVLGMILAIAGTAQGQISVNLHVGTAPAWGPRGYDNARYYYLPDVEAYYDINTSMFIYISGNTWIRRSYLPTRYRGYDLYHGRKVVMNNYHGSTPYYNHNAYITKYGRGNQPAQQQRMSNQNSRNVRSRTVIVNNRNVGSNRNGGNNKGNGNSGKKGKNK